MNKKYSNKAKFTEVTVTEIGVLGDGIANGPEGRYYVPFSVPGDRLVVEVGETRKDGRAATIKTLVSPGADRIEPTCRHFGPCGGCALQHVSPNALAKTKRDFVVAALARRGLGDIDVLQTQSIRPGARRRVRFAVDRKRATILGFHARRSRRVFDLSECPAVRPAVAAIAAPLRTLIAAMESLGRKAAVLVSETDNGLDVLVRPEPRRDPTLRDREAMAQFADDRDLARIAWDGENGPEPIAARREPRLRFGPAPVAVPPGAFLQPSAAGENTIARAALEALDGATNIADLYAGCGALTFRLSTIAPTHAFEGDPDMVRAIRQAAANLPVTATTRDLARAPLSARELAAFDAIVFDPPRVGAKAQAGEIAESAVAAVIAVSCNPATLARDLRILVDGGYRIESVLPIDQFPWSPHIEAVAVLRR